MASSFLEQKAKEQAARSKKKYKPGEVVQAMPTPKNNTVLKVTRDDIAPVKSTVDDERKWFEKGAFEDGWQFGDLAKTILGTTTDVTENLGTGVIGMGEKLIDTLAAISPYVTQGQYYQNGGAYQSLGQQKMFEKQIKQDKKTMSEFVKKDLYDEEKIAQKIVLGTDKNSVLGEKSDALIQSAGQLAATAGLQAVGVPWFLTSGVTSFGGEAENALNQGASLEEAALSGAISAGAEILTEKIGGISFGGKTVSDAVLQPFVRGISNKAVRLLANAGIDAVGEGGEEILSGVMSAIGQKLTYMDDKELNEIFTKEDAAEAFVGGLVLGGGSNVIGAIKSEKKGVDAVTGLTKNEQKVVDHEYQKRIKAEPDKKKSKIYDEVVRDMERGRISTDTIEEVLGGDTYKNYKDTIDSEDAIAKEYEELGKLKDATLAEQTRYKELHEQMKNKDTSNRDQLKARLGDEVMSMVKGDRLSESYNERARRSQAFEADLTKYDAKQQETIKKAVESGILNNTNATHDFVDLVAKITADKGVPFDFTNNERLKESGFALDGKSVNGYVTKDGVTLNIESAKSLNSVVGHEITHVLEGTELYDALKNAVTEYSKSKGDYQGRYDALAKLYEGVDGANVDAELTADLVGDYLFTDSDFINNLSVNNRNVFQKIFDEIKYLCKVATAGSKEARELEKVKKAFEEAYRAIKNTTTEGGGVQYKLSDIDIDRNFIDYTDKESSNVAIDEKVADLVSRGKTVPLSPDSITAYEANTDWTDKTAVRKILREVLEPNLGVSVEFKHDGQSATAYLTRDGVNHSVGGVASPRKASAFEMFNALVKNAEYTYSSENDPHSNSSKNIEGEIEWDTFVAAATVNGEPYPVVFKIRSIDSDVRSQIYEMATKNETGFSHGDGSGESPADAHPNYGTSPISGNNVSQKPQDVKMSLLDSDNNLKVMDGGTVTKYSLSTWTPETQTKVRGNLVKAGYEADRVDKWIKDVNGVASMIAADRDRLDFEAADNQTMLKNNEEYVKTLDASTLCAKRLVYQGTFDAIQHRMPNTMLSSDDLIDLLNMMKEHGVQTPCGVCYVESRRRHLGKFAQEWLDGYKGVYKPNLDEVTTSDGLEALRKSHPDTYEDFMTAMKKKGSANPKVVQLRTEYRNEIMSLTPSQIRKIEAIGGLRVQSFSDFETPHLLDMMQAVMDMSAKGLSSQAYTKVPNFAWVFGDTGIKINLSLIAEGNGFDSDGNLAFSSVEGMDIDEAMRLRDAYSKNVGTIIVGANDEHILACMADDRIDFIIPFHRSGWGQKELDMMGMADYTDYTYGQKEHSLETGKGVANLYPPDYWDYNLTGKENAERYLNLCAKTGREPKFSQFLVNNGDGSYSLQPDGSTDGYWKLLIDFKMYDNDGNGAEQQKVQPNFNMDEAYRVLNEYEGGANKLPVANDVVEEFVAKHQHRGDLAPTRSLSAENEQIAPIGNYNVYGKDIALETADDIAPVRATVPTTQSAKNVVPPPQPTEEKKEARPTTRKELHSGILESIKSKFNGHGFDFDKVLKNAKNLSTFSTVDNTPQRVMEKALGYKEGQILSDITVNKVAQNETEGIKWLNSFTDKKNGLLKQISEQYHIKPGSKESAAAQMYAEGFYVNDKNDIIAYGDAELAKDFPDAKVQANIKGLAGDARIRQIYDDTLAAINESRARNAYPEIQRLDNYFLHFRAMDDTFSRLGLPFNPNDIRAKDLPTDLNGVTADLKPGQPFFASAMHRTGKRTSFDLLGGLERYLTSAKNQIYHIDDIQTLRALRNYIADTYGQANGLEGLDALSEEEAQDRIEKVYGSHLSTFAKFLNEEANILAGKTALIDRGVEGFLGRRAMTFMNDLNKQVGSNMVGYNVSSSLTNFLPVAQTLAKANKGAFVKAFGQTVAHKLSGRSDGFAEQSPVMIRRNGADRFYRTTWQKLGDPGYALMSAVDNISTELIARTKYNELTSKGMDSQKAHYETDKWVSRLMGDRSIGQMPQLYNSKALGLITKFQLEVRNQLDSQFYDTIQEAKVSNEHIQNELERNAKTAAKVASTFVQLAVVQNLFGKAFESVAGYNPAFDIIEVLMTAFGFDDEEDSEDTVLDNIEEGFLALLEDLPYTSIITDGGRIPISAALPIGELVKGEDEWGNEKSRWETLGEIAPYYVLPGGYGQVKKTVQGLDMFSDEHPIAGSYTDSGNLRFPVEDTLKNRVQAGVFGQWATENANDYFDNERSPLREKQIQEFIDLDIPIRDYWEYREGLSGLSKLSEKADYIADLDLPIDKKNLLINNIADRKEKIDLTGYEDFGGFEEFDFAVKNPEKYKIAEEVGGYEAYMKYQEDMKDMKLAEKVDYVAGLNLTTEQKNVLINGETERKEPIDLTGYENYSSLDELDFATKNPESYAVAKVVGGYDAYRGYTDALGDIKADKDKNGKTISNSRKKKVLDYINNLDADYYTKIILWKSEYTSDNTYNAEILKHLNGRKDISNEEKVAILKKLGFKVSSDGKSVSW